MCLSIPSKVIEINEEERTAIVDTMGVKRKTSIEFIADEVKVGDYVLTSSTSTPGLIFRAACLARSTLKSKCGNKSIFVIKTKSA